MTTPGDTTTQAMILELLRAGARTWDELRAETRTDDESLGYAVGELLDLRKIWTQEREGVRVYGLELRTGLCPRFEHPERRAASGAS